jgi:HEAT repeat protein
VTARALEREVVPLLRRIAADPGANFDVQSAAALALARMGRREAAPLLAGLARDPSGRTHPVVEESAVLALGLLQDTDPRIRSFLAEFAKDRAARTRARCFAAFSLGLLGGPDVAPADREGSLDALRSLVTRPGEANRDVAAAALVGIGLLGDPAALPDLLRWIESGEAAGEPLDELRLAHAVSAVGRIGLAGTSGPGSRDALEGLRAVLRRRARLPRWSAVVAVGQVAPSGDLRVQGECVAILAEVARTPGDSQASNFALAGLGRVASSPACLPQARDACVAALLEAFDRRGTSRSFAAIGLGLAGRSMEGPARTVVVEKVRDALARAPGDAEQKGALCISAGLLRDASSVPVLASILADRGADAVLRGTAAVALGLAGDRSAAPAVRAALEEKADQRLRVEAAVAAGLLADNGAVDALVRILEDPRATQYALGSAAASLGRIGDQRAVAPLCAIVRDTGSTYPDLTRALAVVALGQLGDLFDVPVLARISKDLNYRAYFDALGEVLTIL